MKKFVFAGSFDPFTNGHKAIVDQFYSLCGVHDYLVILVAANSNKGSGLIPYKQRLALIKKIFSDRRGIAVDYTTGTVADYCRKHNVTYLIRGVRNATDIDNEKNIAQINKKLCGVDTLLSFGFCEPYGIDVSSSIVRELHKYNEDIDEYVPKEVSDYLKEVNKL